MIQNIKYRKKFKHRFSKNIYKRFGFKLDDLLTQTYFCTKCKHNHIKKWFDDYGKEFKINDIYLRHFRLADFSSIKQCEVKISGTSDSLKGYFDDYILYDSKDFSKNYQFIAGKIEKKTLTNDTKESKQKERFDNILFKLLDLRHKINLIYQKEKYSILNKYKQENNQEHRPKYKSLKQLIKSRKVDI